MFQEKRLLLDVVVMVAEVAAHAVAADGPPVAEFDMAVIELEVDAAVVRDGVLIRAFGGAAAGQNARSRSGIILIQWGNDRDSPYRSLGVPVV